MQSLLAMQSWQSAQALQANQSVNLTAMQLDVLLVTSPLTLLLEQKYHLRLDVQLHEQHVGVARGVEVALLGIGEDEACLRRRVSLLFQDEVMFDAESILPLGTVSAELMVALESGVRPLANLLSDRGLSLSRSALRVTQVESDDSYHQCWARRSVLASESGATALVTEVFHDVIWKKLRWSSVV